MFAAGENISSELFANLGFTIGYFTTIVALSWRPNLALGPFLVMLASSLFLQQEFGPLLMSAIILALAAYAVTIIPLGIMVVAALSWEISWRFLHDAVDGRLLWPIPIVILILVPGRSIRFLVHRSQQEREAAVAQKEDARRRELALVEENKRQRLVVSRELHDVVAHELTRIAMQSSVGQLSREPHEHQEALQAISGSARTAMAEMRRLVQLLNEDENEPSAGGPPGEGIGSLDLNQELDRAARYLGDLGFRPHRRVEGGVDQIPPGLLPTSVTILREATTNVVKHGTPGVKCELSICVSDTDLTIEVRNELSDGLLDLPESGVGLTGLRARVTDLNGTFTAVAQNGWWEVKATMPLADVRSSTI